MFERVLAAIVIAICALMLVRLALGARRRLRFDAFFRRLWLRMRHAGYTVHRWREARRNAERARKAADELIKRARDRGEWDGNVYTPKSFRKPPRDKMH
jgi:predicted nucleic acid-binding protein